MKSNEEIKNVILSKFKTESQCAKVLGWPRQRLNKITTNKKEPSVYELNALANVLDKSVSEIISFFLM